MSGGTEQRSTPLGLLFIIFLSFIAAFLTARLFTTLFPSTVIVTGGVHFHHFWYGLGMVVVAGCLGIVHDKPSLRRFYAVVFGLGGGLIGDEVGLLLTLGNYHSDLTYFFFVTVVVAGGIGFLAFGRRKDIEYDVFSVEWAERTVYVGTAIAAMSALAFAVGNLFLGSAILTAGILVALLGIWWHRKK